MGGWGGGKHKQQPAADMSGLVKYFKKVFLDGPVDWSEIDLIHSISFDTGQAMRALVDGVFRGDEAAFHDNVNVAFYRGYALRNGNPNYTYAKLMERVKAAGIPVWSALDRMKAREDEWKQRFGLR